MKSKKPVSARKKPEKVAAEKSKAVEKERRLAAKREAQRIKEREKLAAEKEARQVKEKEKLAAEKRRRELAEQRNKRAAEKQAKRNAVYAAIKRKLKNNPYAFDYGNSGVLPRVGITVTGDGQWAVSRLTSKQIEVKDIVKKPGKWSFKIQKKDMAKAIAILDEMCYNYTVDDLYGVTRSLAFFMSRIGILLGIAASAVGLCLMYSHIWRVEIIGNEKLSAETIAVALGEIGITPGLKKNRTDASAVVRAVNGIDGIVDASAEIVGTTLRVNVLEADDYTVHGSFAAYKSAYDATVTRIVMRSGTAKVKSGDVVTSGTVLADGSVYSTTGELMYVGECDGEIYGNIALTYSVTVADTTVEYRRTGAAHKKTSLKLFGKELFVPHSPYASYETVVSTANYDVLLPLYATTYTFYETAPIETERDVNELAQAFADQKKRELDFSGLEPQKKIVIEQRSAGLYNIRLFLSGEARISVGCDTQAP